MPYFLIITLSVAISVISVALAKCHRHLLWSILLGLFAVIAAVVIKLLAGLVWGLLLFCIVLCFYGWRRHGVEETKWAATLFLIGVLGSIGCGMYQVSFQLFANKEKARDELVISERIIKNHEKLSQKTPLEYRQMVKAQAAILDADESRALNTLVRLLPTQKERQEALKIAKEIAMADLVVVQEEEHIMDKIKNALNLDSKD